MANGLILKLPNGLSVNFHYWMFLQKPACQILPLSSSVVHSSPTGKRLIIAGGLEGTAWTYKRFFEFATKPGTDGRKPYWRFTYFCPAGGFVY